MKNKLYLENYVKQKPKGPLNNPLPKGFSCSLFMMPSDPLGLRTVIDESVQSQAPGFKSLRKLSHGLQGSQVQVHELHCKQKCNTRSLLMQLDPTINHLNQYSAIYSTGLQRAQTEWLIVTTSISTRKHSCHLTLLSLAN